MPKYDDFDLDLKNEKVVDKAQNVAVGSVITVTTYTIVKTAWCTSNTCTNLDCSRANCA